MGKDMKTYTVIAATAALSSTALLSGCYSSRTTEVVPPATAAVPAPTCYFSNVPYSVGSRVVTPQGRTVECARDGYWHTVQ